MNGKSISKPAKFIILPTFKTKYENGKKIMNHKLVGTNKNEIRTFNGLYICKENNIINIKSISTIDINYIKEIK